MSEKRRRRARLTRCVVGRQKSNAGGPTGRGFPDLGGIGEEDVPSSLLLLLHTCAGCLVMWQRWRRGGWGTRNEESQLVAGHPSPSVVAATWGAFVWRRCVASRVEGNSDVL